MFFLKELPTQKMLQHYAEKHPEMDLGKTDRALRMLRKASLLIRKLDAYFSGHGLSQTRFLILIVLDREPEREYLSMRDLVQRLDISKPVITNTLKALEKEDYVSISECDQDARAKRIATTAKGRKKLNDVLPGYYALISREVEEIK